MVLQHSKHQSQIKHQPWMPKYYAQAVDPMLLTALETLAIQHSQGTQDTMEALMQLLN